MMMSQRLKGKYVKEGVRDFVEMGLIPPPRTWDDRDAKFVHLALIGLTRYQIKKHENEIGFIIVDRNIVDALVYWRVLVGYPFPMENELLRYYEELVDYQLLFDPISYDDDGFRLGENLLEKEILEFKTVTDKLRIPVIKVPPASPEERLDYIMRKLKGYGENVP